MKLKQALIIGLSSAVLALPAIAAESATDLKDAKTMKPMTMEMPAKTFHHKKGHKKVSMKKKMDTEQAKENAELNALSESAAGKEQAKENAKLNALSESTAGNDQAETKIS